MKLSLQCCFDLGVSFGLRDDVLQAPPAAADQKQYKYHVREPERYRRALGIRNPLGEGVPCKLEDVRPQVLALWREKALLLVNDPDMELGYEDDDPRNRERLKEEVRQLVQRYPIESCELTVYTIGAVFLRLDFANGLQRHLKQLQGLYKCFEFAGYTPEVSDALLDVAHETAAVAFRGQGKGLQDLARRPQPLIQADRQGKADSRLISGFSCVALCVQDRGEAQLPADDVGAVKAALRNVATGTFEELTFDYHGKMHWDWAASVIEPRLASRRTEPIPVEIDRMLYCIQIAHVFLGICEAFERLLLNETFLQADGYVKGVRAGRSPRALNRLRTLALAVVSLTRFDTASAAEEDQEYFRRFESQAHIADRHGRIQQQCEILLNVQAAETQAEEAKREKILNRAVLVLTAFTLVSVLVESYQFVREDEHWFQWVYRLDILALSIAAIALVIVVLLRFLARPDRGG
jgi:hypothetical protein